MNERFFADQRDYFKYSILRHLLAHDIACTVCWMLTPEENGPGNRLEDYVDDAANWQHLDPAIFNFLNDQLRPGPPNMLSIAQPQSPHHRLSNSIGTRSRSIKTKDSITSTPASTPRTAHSSSLSIRIPVPFHGTVQPPTSCTDTSNGTKSLTSTTTVSQSSYTNTCPRNVHERATTPRRKTRRLTRNTRRRNRSHPPRRRHRIPFRRASKPRPTDTVSHKDDHHSLDRTATSTSAINRRTTNANPNPSKAALMLVRPGMRGEFRGIAVP